MRRAALSAARAALLAGPTVLAFFTGGYFNGPRAWAGLVAWLLVAVAAVAEPAALAFRRPAWLALAGLALLAAWTLLSILWAPIASSAYHAGQIVFVYLGYLLAAGMLLRSRSALRAVEPALAAGTLVVIGYGLSERLLPGLLHFARSFTALGRLEQPLTYWNAMGLVAAIGLVLCARLAGDASRPSALRVAAAAGSAPLGMGLYITFSRGGLFAYAAGMITLLVLVRRREQLRGAIVSFGAAALGAIVSTPFRGVTGLDGSLSSREGQGALALVLLALVIALAVAAAWALSRRPTEQELRLPRRAPQIAFVLIVALLALAVAVGSRESDGTSAAQGATRLATLQSSRYSYWRVAMNAFGDEPLRGVGAGGWAVYWLRQRPNSGAALDAHSLEIQTLAELGVIGLALLLASLGGIALAARDALRAAPALAAGPVAGFVVWATHSLLDWDWQMPAVTLIAIGLAGALLALASAGVNEERQLTGADR